MLAPCYLRSNPYKIRFPHFSYLNFFPKWRFYYRGLVPSIYCCSNHLYLNYVIWKKFKRQKCGYTDFIRVWPWIARGTHGVARDTPLLWLVWLEIWYSCSARYVLSSHRKSRKVVVNFSGYGFVKIQKNTKTTWWDWRAAPSTIKLERSVLLYSYSQQPCLHACRKDQKVVVNFSSYEALKRGTKWKNHIFYPTFKAILWSVSRQLFDLLNIRLGKDLDFHHAKDESCQVTWYFAPCPKVGHAFAMFFLILGGHIC